MPEFLVEVVGRFLLMSLIWLLLIVPASSVVFLYQLVVRRSFSEAWQVAWRVARNIMEKTAISEGI